MESYAEIIDTVQLVMVLVGLAANLLTVVSLICNGGTFSPAILTLLRNQSGLDAWICFLTTLMLIQQPMWLTANPTVNFILCQIWHSQGTYWVAMLSSIWNLVAISFERFLAVCHPFKHGEFRTGKVRLTIFLIYVICFLIIFPAFFQVKLSNGKCVSEYAIPGKIGHLFFYGYSVFSFMVVYAIPCILFFILYGFIIQTFNRRQHNSNMGASRTIDKANKELTKTAVVVTAIFIIALGYDCWYYMLGRTGVVVYIKNSFIQKIGIVLASFNSVCNPFVYALLMPAYLSCVKKTILALALKNNIKMTSN